MDFVVKKGELLRELQYVQGVVERKTTVPILANLLLEPTGTTLAITATDLDVTVRCSCPASVKVTGALTVPARKLFEIVRLLPEADVHFKSTGKDWLQIVCERSRFRSAGLPKEHFPDVPEPTGPMVQLPGDPLRYMIARCIFAITQEDSRYALNGALMLIEPGGLSLVTTDGHRLAVISTNQEISGVQGERRVLVPKKTLVELGKLISEDTAEVEFGDTENHLFFRLGDRFLVSRILAGQFPNYEVVIPRDNDREVVVNTLDFTDALRRVAVMADEHSHGVRFVVKEGQIDIMATNPDYGEAKETLPALYPGEPLEVGFNAQYVLDFLNVLETDEVVLQLKDADTQGLLRPRELEGYHYQYVVMPLKI